MRQFRANVDDDLYHRIQLTKAKLEAETNTELIEKLLNEVEAKP